MKGEPTRSVATGRREVSMLCCWQDTSCFQRSRKGRLPLNSKSRSVVAVTWSVSDLLCSPCCSALHLAAGRTDLRKRMSRYRWSPLECHFAAIYLREALPRRRVVAATLLHASTPWSATKKPLIPLPLRGKRCVEGELPSLATEVTLCREGDCREEGAAVASREPCCRFEVLPWEPCCCCREEGA